MHTEPVAESYSTFWDQTEDTQKTVILRDEDVYAEFLAATEDGDEPEVE
jgi:hypothetical protein